MPACLVLALVVALPLPAAEGGPPPHVGRAFLFQADLETGRRNGWIEPAEEDEPVLDRIAETLRSRVHLVGKFAEARVIREKGARFSVTFVGHQPEPYERFISAGLARPARLELRLRPPDGDLQEPDRVAARSEPEGREDPRVLPEPALLLGRSDLVGLQGRSGSALAFQLAPEAEAWARKHLEAHPGHHLVLLLDGSTAWVGPGVPDRPIVVEVADVEELRSLVLALAGGPLPAPLAFVGFGERPLEEVGRPPDPDLREIMEP